MVGDYSFMNLVSIATLITAVGTALAVIIPIIGLFRDNKAILRRFDEVFDKISHEKKFLSKEHEGLLKEYEGSSKEHMGLSKEHSDIKDDTNYIKEQMLLEKISRQNLYNNVSNAEEILTKLDFLRETVIQNATLHEQNDKLKSEIVDLKISNSVLSNKLDTQNVGRLIGDIKRFETKLSNFEMYQESEEIKIELKRILQELTND